MADKRFENMLSPLQIGSVTVKNRFGMGPMGVPQVFAGNGIITDDAIDYFVDHAAGGYGFIVMGAQQADNEVDPEIPASPLGFKHNPGLFRKQMLKLNERVASFGTKMFPQISAGLGRNYPGFRAPSAVECYGFPDQKGIEMTKDEIKKKIDAVVNLAKVEQSVGMAGVEVHAMHWGYLLDEFAMSIMNKREDEYGGSLENRMRMAKEIVQGIKQECGQDFPVMMRLGIKSYIKGLNKASFDGSDEAGRTLEEGIKICQLLEEYGYDALDLDTGVYDSFYYACPPSYIQQGYAVDLYAQAKAAVKIPVIAGSRMQDPFIAEDAVRAGKIDGVLLSRPAMADPYLPAKVQMGKPEKIRPCIACNQCFARSLDDDQFLTCGVNTTANKASQSQLKRALISKKVVVVGGGVGGLEAARDARLCGHDVELYERDSILGGLLNPAGAMSVKKEMAQLLKWYELELQELGIKVHLNSEMNAEKVIALNPDAVIIAAGSSPLAMPFIPGINNKKVVPCTTALMNKKDLGQKIAVIGGGNVGCEVAIELSTVDKKDVVIVERLEKLMPSGGAGKEASATKMCMQDMVSHYNVKVQTDCSLQEVTDDGIIVQKNGETATIEVDNVVLATGFALNPTFSQELNENGFVVYEITGGGEGLPNVFRATQEAFEIATHL